MKLEAMIRMLILVLGVTLGACGGGGGDPSTPSEDVVAEDAGADLDSGPGVDVLSDLYGDTGEPGEDSAGPDAPTADLDVEPPPDTSPPDTSPDIVADVAPEIIPTECDDPEDCQALHGAATSCHAWSCEEGVCVEVPALVGSSCEDGESCTLDDTCDGSGVCQPGAADPCDDTNPCTDDSCTSGVGCQHVQVPPQPCTDGNGYPGTTSCVGGAWGDCVASAPCDILVNTGTDGTVNPYIFQAREGKFYVSFVEHTAGGADLKLAWLDPATCQVTQGPFTVNDPVDSVYYWGSQAAVSDSAGNYYAVWEAKSGFGEIGFASSVTGVDFGPAVEAVSTSDNGQYPVLAVPSPGTVYVAWSGFIDSAAPAGFEYDPFVTTNTDVFGVGAFSQAVQVAATPIQDDAVALVVSPAGDVYVAWESFQDGSPDGGNIYVAKSTDGGLNFGPAVQVNDVATHASVGKSTFMAWGDDALHLVWSDTRDDSEGDVYYDRAGPSLDFGADVMVNDDTYRYQEDPSIVVGEGAACAGTVYVVWQDLRSNNGYDIYGARRIPGAPGFDANILINPQTDEDQMNPALGVDPGCVVGVTWRDNGVNSQFDIKATFLPLW
ncbi:MAG: hypothetical protein ABIK09_16945 [Pseudomonadota bacterium]